MLLAFGRRYPLPQAHGRRPERREGGPRESRDAGRRGRARGGEGQRSLATAFEGGVEDEGGVLG